MTIHLRLILLPIFIGLLMLSILGTSIYAIKQYLNELLVLEQIKKESLYEIEINLKEAAAEVVLVGSNHQNLTLSESLFADAQQDFLQAYETYARLAVPQVLKDSQLTKLSQVFFTQGESIFKDTQRLFEVIQERRQLLNETIDVQLDEIIQPQALADSNLSSLKQQAAFEIEINMHELVSAVRGYLLKQDSFFLERLRDSEDDLNHWLRVYQEQSLNELEKATLKKLVSETLLIERLSQDIIDIKQKLMSESAEFNSLLRQLDDILDNNLQSKGDLKFNQAFDGLNELLMFFSMLLGGMIIVSTIIIRMATRPIIKHINDLKQSTHTFQDEQLIIMPKDTPDELGALSHDLEEMMTSLKANTSKLEQLALYDALTGLPNRMLLADRLNSAIAGNKRNQAKVAVLFIDLDGFKLVNDTFGHNVGDQLLIDISMDLTNQLRESDTLARIGGDEFIILLPNVNKQADIHPLLNKLLTIVAKQRIIDNNYTNVSASIGINMVLPTSHDDADQVVRKADMAMYQAKQSGKNQFHFFNADEDKQIRTQNKQLNSIEQAISNQEFTLHYQPKVNLNDGSVFGVEALILWQHPEEGLKPPISFLPYISDHPLMIALGDWVIAEAIKQTSEWQKQGLNLVVSINVEAIQLAQVDFMSKLQNCLANSPNIRPQNIELEMLETIALENNQQLYEVFSQCQKMGINLALDDFGTGYSSLSYLKRVPASVLKIDRSFINDILIDIDNLTIIEGIIKLSETFKMDVIAEGVEEIEQGLILKMLGCDRIQGYCVAKPMPTLEFQAWLSDWHLPESWQVSALLKLEDRAITYAIAEHTKWVHEVTLYAQKKRVQPPELNPHRCQFFSWLDKQPNQTALSEIKALHDEIHQKATALAESSLQNLAIEDQIDAIHQTKDTLIAKLFELAEMKNPSKH